MPPNTPLSRTEQLADLYEMGALPPDVSQRYEEAALRGLVRDPAAARQAFRRQQTRIFQDAGARSPPPGPAPVNGMTRARQTYGRDRPGGYQHDFQGQLVGSLGAGDEVGGAMAYGVQGAINLGHRALGQPITVGASDAYNAVAEAERGAQAEYAAQHPVLNNLATLGGFLAAGAPNSTAGAAPVVGNAVRRTLTMAGRGALQAAPFAYVNQGGSVAERLPGTIAGMALGGGLAGGLNVAGKGLNTLSGVTRARPPSPQRVLSNAGVELTPGRMLGAPTRVVEDAMTSVPFSGVGAAQDRSVESLNRVMADQTLAPIGQTLPRNIQPGRAAVNHVKAAISGHYTTALAPVAVAPDAQLGTEVTAALNGVRNVRMRADTRSLVDDVLGDFQGPISGNDWKALDERLGAAAASADRGAASNPVMRQQATGLRQVQTALRGVLQRTDPAAAQAVGQADAAYARFIRLRNASTRAGAAARGGIATPTGMNAAVTGASNVDQVSRGSALLQGLTEPAMQVLPSKIGNSGTAERRLMQIILTGGLAGGGHMAGPVGDAAVGLGLTATALSALAYSRPAQRALNVIYRASGRVPVADIQAALGVLAQEASRNPALQPVLQRALRSTGQSGGQSSGTQPTAGAIVP